MLVFKAWPATKIVSALTKEPKIPNEIAKELDLNRRTAQVEFMRLAITHPNETGYKRIGRTNLFWKKAKK